MPDRTRVMDTHHRLPGSASQDVSDAGAIPNTAGSRKRRRAKGKEVEVTAEPKEVREEAWSWRSLTDSSASRVPPLFTKDGSYFFSAAGPSIKIYSVATGEVVSTLTPTSSGASGSSARPENDVVTAAILNPHNPFQLITGSLDGFIRVWDFLDAALLQTVGIAQPIFHLTAHEAFRECVFVAAARPSKKKTSKGSGTTNEDNVVVLRVSLQASAATAGLVVQTSSEIIAVGKTRSTTGLAISPSGAWLVATGGHKAYVCNTADIKAGFTKFVSPERLTCLAFHPTEEYFATGDATGCIRLWYCLNESITIKSAGVEKTAQTTTLHWHAHAVASIAFTSNGAYLLSGGEEAVFVIWQLHTGKKEYVPRVGAPIVHVTLLSTGGEEEYLLSLADASFAFIRASSLKISRSISRIKLDPAISHSRPSTSSSVPLAAHPLTSTLILPSSHPSSLQTYSPSSSKLLSELEVSPSNRISRRDDKALEPARVEHAEVSESGDWMATVDIREADESFRAEVYLKVWQWDRRAGYWILNTRIDRPHGLSRVVGMAFRPNVRDKANMLLVTTGGDGNVKTWRIRFRQSKSEDVEDFWVTRSSLRFRGETPSGVAWSPDGSLYAVCVGRQVALYDPDTNALCQVLSSPASGSMSRCMFLGQSGRFLVVNGPQDVLVWDLVTHHLRWHYRSTSVLESATSHVLEERFVVLERGAHSTTQAPSTRVLEFEPSSPTPVATRTLPFSLRSVIPAPADGFFAGEPSSFTLIGITDSWSVVVFGDDVQLPDEEGAFAQGIVPDAGTGRRSLFHDIFGTDAFDGLAPTRRPAVAASVAQPWKGKEVAQVFDAPAHLLPPLESLFDAVMDGFLTERVAEATEPEPEPELDQREEMDVDEVPGTVPLASTTPGRIERVVDRQEMQSFVELFKHYAIKAPSSSRPSVPQPHLNGVHKPNGVHLPNGTHATPSKPVPKLNGATPKAAPSTHPSITDSSSPYVKAGQKRKKSLG